MKRLEHLRSRPKIQTAFFNDRMRNNIEGARVDPNWDPIVRRDSTAKWRFGPQQRAVSEYQRLATEPFNLIGTPLKET
jgi:hypothetical protein